MSKVKKEKVARLYWQNWIEIYFSFCRENFGISPSFDGPSPRDMGMIYDAVKKKCEEKEIEWSEDISTRSWKTFLKFASEDKWLNENFLLSNLNRQKDKIFIKINNSINGKSNSGLQKSISNNYKTAGSDVYAERLRSQLDELNGNGGQDR